MTRQTALEILQVDTEHGTSLHLRENYSGRGQWDGENTTAITGLYEDLEDVLSLADLYLVDFRLDTIGKNNFYVIY